MAVIVKRLLELNLFQDLVILDDETYDFIYRKVIERVGKYFSQVSKSMVMSTIVAFKGELKYEGKGKTITIRPFIYEVDGLKGFALVSLDFSITGKNAYREIFIRYIMEKISLKETDDVFIMDSTLFVKIPIGIPIKEEERRNGPMGQKVFKRV